ncbi:MAG: porin family protein [Muribaculaceae bacterium]|nr:porin family protein [Muribaculaceae bacterium]
MKKILILVMCIAAICGTMSGQVGSFKLGAKAGLNISNCWGDDTDGDAKIGYQVGVTAEYRASSLIAIAPELVFSAQGTKDSQVTNTINYINLPIMAKFYVIEPLSIDFGPEFGYAVYNHLAGEKVEGSLYNKFNVGLGIGATYNICKFAINARYTMGLTNVYKDLSVKNYNIQIGLGYKF